MKYSIKFRIILLLTISKLIISLNYQFKFKLVRSYSLSNNQNVILSRYFEDIKMKFQCFNYCFKLAECKFISLKSNLCILHRYQAIFSKILYNKDSILYEKEPIFNEKGLIHYWPIQNSTTKDIINNKDLYSPTNTNFTSDRFGNLNSALSLNKGFYNFPPGVYFTNDFSISVWVRIKNIQNYARIVDFGDNQNDNVILAFSYGLNGNPFCIVRNSNQEQAKIISKIQPELNKWFNIVSVLNNTNHSLYINATLVGSGSSYKPRNVNRTRNYLGKGNWPNEDLAWADIDDLKIFNHALTLQEIKQQYFNN